MSTETLEQHIFNRVIVHQLAQGRKCRVGGKSVIRNGRLADPIGAVIVDNKAAEEAGAVGAVGCSDLLRASGIRPTHDVIALLGELQDIHDGEPYKNWLARFKEVAADNGLEFPDEAARQAWLSRHALRSGFAKKAWATRKSRPKAAGHKARATFLIGV